MAESAIDPKLQPEEEDEEDDDYELPAEEEGEEESDEDEEDEDQGESLTALLLGDTSRVTDNDDDNDRSWTPDGGVDPAEVEDDEEHDDAKATEEKAKSTDATAVANGASVGTKRARDDVDEGTESKKTKV
ncbi:hypothetical protein SISNIDRAFT_485774 [Sistotremastrum niveocremeum HHB9708]|uniref:Uncharacterized protein n=1 Tax=Sistotremastrum niveocremeum HHB9708 TaxID=1314777 RepID=A0A164UTN6_9AGAM|nr:hypothetical protein SISNIDRAFT_485774 [Sistotremastrum niveocremeum HHB9708]